MKTVESEVTTREYDHLEKRASFLTDEQIDMYKKQFREFLLNTSDICIDTEIGEGMMLVLGEYATSNRCIWKSIQSYDR